MTARAERKAITLGPFTGGMNNLGELETLDDDELSYVVNFEMSQDGSMQSRPAILPESALLSDTGLVMLGAYRNNIDELFIVCARGGATWLYRVADKTWQTIWEHPASGYVQYDNKVVLCSRDFSGGYWEGGTFTATPGMPLAEAIVLHQERFWVFGAKGTGASSRVTFSKVTSISPPQSIFDWGPTDFFTVEQGDGQWITGLLPVGQRLFIFRNASTYNFVYPASPLNGTLSMTSAMIGADTRRSFASYENYHLVLSQGTLYQFLNSNFYQLNQRKIAFQPRSIVAGTVIDRAVSVFGNRAIVWYHGATYVYNLVRKTWSMWESSASEAAHFLQLPDSYGGPTGAIAIASTGGGGADTRRLWRIQEAPLEGATSGEQITCVMRTKSYAFDSNSEYKRLMWWAVEARTATGLTATAAPLSISTAGTTWDIMDLHTWDEMAEGTWDNFFVGRPVVVDAVPNPLSTPQIGVYRLRKSLRFLRIYFEVMIQVDGTRKTSPARINVIQPYVRLKATVAGKVN